MKALRIIAWIYAGLCVLSLALLAIGTFGWFGQEQDPVSAIYAVLLAMPWPLVFGGFDNPTAGVIVLIAGMALNLVIILSIGKFMSRKSGASTPDHSNP